MSYEPGAIDATLVAAVGDDPVLIAELREAFAASVDAALVALATARDGEEWRAAAWRLKGLAASFGATRLTTLATQAAARTVDDEATLTALREAAARL